MSGSQLRTASGPEQVLAALGSALDGGRPVAPLPEDQVERDHALAMLRPEAELVEPDPGAVVATSGSTGVPKGVVLSRAAIVAAVHATHERLGGSGSWVLALPEHYVAGLMVLARTVVAGTPLAMISPDLVGLPAVVNALPGRKYLSLVQPQLARALRRPEVVDGLGRLDAVLLGGSPPDLDLVARAQQQRIRVVVTYGMSETCGGCVYDGVPLAGVEIAVDVASGWISVTSPTVFSGYRLDPELTARTLTGRTFRTGDRGRWTDGRLHVDGRVDDVVVSGGRNVDLAAVERRVREWSVDGETAVVALPDPEWGVEVVAVTEGPGTTEQLRTALSTVLPRHALPQRLIRVHSLPRTVTGKVDRPRLVADLTGSTRRER